MRTLTLASLFTLLACLTACGGPNGSPGNDKSPAATGKPRVYAVNYPLAWAAEQLSGDAADVHFPAPAGIDPAFWEPDLETMAAYQQADLILLNGANYAKWISKVSLPRNRMVDTSEGVADQYIAIDSGPVHSHGPEGGHSHGEVAFTVWLDLVLYAAQVGSIADALSALIPDDKPVIDQRRDELVTQLMELDAQLLQVGKRLDGAPILYSHAVYQYLQRRYALNGLALHWEPDREPSESDWAELDSIISRHAAGLMLWEGEPTAATRNALAKRNVAVVVFNPAANRGTEGDFASILQSNVERLAAAVAN